MSDCCFEGQCAPSVCFDGGGVSSAGCWSPGESSSFCNSTGYSSDCSVGTAASSGSLDFSTATIYGNSGDSRAIGTAGDSSFAKSAMSPRQDQAELAKPGESPKIIVSNDSSVTPDYIVKKDGQVEQVGDPTSGDKPHSVYRIQVEPGADQKATDALVSRINDSIRQKDSTAQATLYATPGLVSDDLRKAFEAKAPSPADDVNPNPETPPEDSAPPSDDESPSNPGGGDCPSCPNSPNSPSDDSSPSDTPSEVPPETLPSDLPANVVASPMDNLIDAARLNTWENGTNNALGAYEVNMGNWYSSWLTPEMLEELGNPPDYRKLGKILAKAKANPKFQQGMQERLGNMKEQGDTAGADKIDAMFTKLSTDSMYAENFGIFMNGQQSGRNATGEEMQNFFDKDMQKAVASSRVSDVAHEAGVKVKDLPAQKAITMALAGALGHVPTEKEMTEYNKYLQVVGSRFKPAQPGTINQLAQN